MQQVDFKRGDSNNGYCMFMLFGIGSADDR